MSGFRIITPPDDATLMCVAWGKRLFADDMAGTCADCGVAIAHRPHARRFRRKVCVPCGCAELRSRGPAADASVGMTALTAAEVATFLATPKGRA